MKINYFISLQKGFLALMSVALLFSCSQIEPFEMEGNDKVLFSVASTGSGGGDCLDDCIDPANPEYFEQVGTISNNAGSSGTSRIFTYTVYNTLTGFNLDWSYVANNAAGRKLKITVSGAGFSSSQTHISPQYNGSNAGGTHTFTFNSAWAACGVVTVVAEILDGDDVVQSGPNTTTYNLIGECVVGCEDEFSAETTCNGNERSATFTFTAGDDATYTIQGGLTAFISDVIVDGATVINVTGNGNNIISWTGELDECDVKTITVTWNSTNDDPIITGDWTVEKDNVEILVIDELGCDVEGEGYAPEVI